MENEKRKQVKMGQAQYPTVPGRHRPGRCVGLAKKKVLRDFSSPTAPFVFPKIGRLAFASIDGYNFYLEFCST
jgi:hypothetical protein